MSQLSAFPAGGDDQSPVVTSPYLSESNTRAPGFGSGISLVLLLIGAVGTVAALVPVFMGMGADAADPAGQAAAKAAKHALTSYHVGALVVLGLVLGPLGLVMILHLVAAGWCAALRRQAENIASPMLVGLAVVLLLPGMLLSSKLFKWTNDALVQPGPKFDELAVKKAPFLNEPFFLARFALYAAVWLGLSFILNRLSREQDRTGNRWLTLRAQKLSAPGMLAFALTVAFAGFDLIMSLDFHWFSTMFGVYFFAGNMIAGLSLLAVVCGLLRASGKLDGLMTAEHFHDLGKLMLGFTVFWAYIAFSQYFLIWYANIPEETAYYNLRGAGAYTNEWTPVFQLLIFGKFIGPFLILLFRGVKRSPMALGLIGCWIILMHVVDVFFNVRPMVNFPNDKIGLAWVDAAGVIGPVCLFLGLLLRQIASSPLIPLRDPRLNEAIEHKNYV